MSDATSQSVRDRLLNLSRQHQEDFNHLLVQYANERLLYRITQTRHANQFVLKGATLFKLWMGRTHRPTQDLDLLGFGSIEENSLRDMIQDICRVTVEDDGMAFDPASSQIDDIREGEMYHGKRVTIRGYLGTARVDVHIDIGVGDAMTPEPELETYPVLLDLPAPLIRMYSRETVVAEKFDAMLVLGLRNSRMKDYFDLWTLSSNFDFTGKVLQEAIRATLVRRGRPCPTSTPIGLSEQFSENATKQTQWKAFLNRLAPGTNCLELKVIVERIHLFLSPVIKAINKNTSVSKHWQASSQSWITSSP